MADLTTALSTYLAGPLDTRTALSDASNDMLAAHVNGGLSAIVDIEAALGTGNTLKGSKASLVDRLATCLSSSGAINGGTAFPTSPTPVDAQLFWRTDLKQFFIYDGALAQWQRVDSTNIHSQLSGLSADDHPQYAQIAATETISAAWTFASNPVFNAAAIADSALSSNVPLKNGANVFTTRQKRQDSGDTISMSFNRFASNDYQLSTNVLDDSVTQEDNTKHSVLINPDNLAGGLRIQMIPPGGALSVKMAWDLEGKMTTGVVPLARIDGFTASQTINVPSIPAGGFNETNMVVTGAAIGDFVLVGLSAVLPTGITLFAYVSGTDNVHLVWVNQDTIARDPANITYYAKVIKKDF